MSKKKIIKLSFFIIVFNCFLTIKAPVWGETILNSTVKTQLGNFDLSTPSPLLPDLEIAPLFKDTPASLPKLPLWKEKSDSKGYLFIASAEELYLEGLALFNQRQWTKSLDEFNSLIRRYKQSKYYQASLFWSSQILIKLRREDTALRTLNQLISAERSFPYTSRGAHSLIWLLLKQKKYTQALEKIDHFSTTLFAPVDQKNILPLTIYAHLKLNQIESALENLIILQDRFPKNPQFFENVIKISEIYYKLRQWEKINPLIKSIQRQYINQPRMNHLILISLSGDLQEEAWKRGLQKVNWLKKRESVDNDILVQGSFYAALGQNDKKSARSWLNRMRGADLKSENLRYLFHYAVRQKDFSYLTSLSFDSSLIENWADEAHWILGYAYEQQHQVNDAYREYQLARNKTKVPAYKEKLYFNLVVLELKTGNYKRAGGRLEQMIVDYQESEDRSEYFFWYGVVQHELGDYPVLTLKQVDPFSKRADDSQFFLMRYHHSQKEWAKQKTAFDLLTSQYSQSSFNHLAYYYQADSLYHQLRFKEALQLLKNWENQYGSNQISYDMMTLWGKIYVKNEDYIEADKLFDKALVKFGTYEFFDEALKNLGRLENYPKLIDVATRGLSLDFTENQKNSLSFRRAEAAFLTGNANQAIGYYQDALKRDRGENRRYIHHQLAQLYFEQEQFPEFVEMSQRVLKDPIRDEMSNNVLIWLEKYHSSKNNKATADRYLQMRAKNYEAEIAQYTETDPKKIQAILKLAKVKNRLGLFQETNKLLKQAVVPNDSSLAFEVFQMKGITAFSEKRHEDAIKSYLKVVYLNRDLASKEKIDILTKIAYSYEQLASYNDAKAIYQKILREFKEEDIQKQITENLKRLPI